MIFSFFFNAKTIKKIKKPKLSNYPDDVVQVKKKYTRKFSQYNNNVPSDLTPIPTHPPLLRLSSEVTIVKSYLSTFQNILVNIPAYHFTILCT